MSKRNAVAFVKPPEPAFLTAFKKKAGFKEGPSVDTKHEELAFDENQTDREDEKPTVVVLKPGDLTEQEAEEAKEDGAQELDSAEEDDKPPADGKIRFKKPKKRSSDDAAEQEQKKKKASSSKKVKNASLLSFNEEDEEDG
ncbi:uncharacterized protein FJT64_008026 [Amphibalanus amphitrite]|uniref:DUF4604 domain-containing protein n=1 Tax=Amphibalanus amphitrite TaxID=1232801 RepID=A0A6A4VJV5_AMPAM|nr:uncharacterized protein KIAA1143 homolog [Amphibalanus amphitrite]XP_043220611.1 uncharacterized protein KIAA1143 homolog [Amphibalanus amphitrite]XP_043220612.1 uncharacterized protein KIAA1143 homolog [Amphibalanus amphitrite]XP_043220613.1 uncharacterized protein KIAA1143 homolog [Amphibalanus amphitrite]XP_043220614.1 uncharacterized protein KIAA1143 homolog [Amphibalanus amphitrite]XP_043220615.1 uncharacterized protein KIAA1143 homolog [Amphibalanus amphitrite]XP_043220616.1 uncharac